MTYHQGKFDLRTALRMGHHKVWLREQGRKIKGQKRSNPDECYFFQHIPKTAGTSFRFQLYNVFDQHEIFPNLVDLNANNGRYPGFRQFKDEPEKYLVGKKLLMGHLPLQARRLFPQPPRYLVFLRDPHQRMVSLFYHIKRKQLPEGSDLEVLQRIRMDNQQVRQIFGPGPRRIVDAEHVEKAKKRLATADFIGITERYSESISLANRIFEWDLGEPLYMNSFDSEEMDPGIYAELIKCNQMDMLLYEFALERFEHLQKRYGLS